MPCKCLLPDCLRFDPGEPLKSENGIVSAHIIDPDDIKKVTAVDGVITGIKMKRKGTYHGKRYDRAIHKLTYK